MNYFQYTQITGIKKPQVELEVFKFWSGKRDSNSRPQPWQGYALPTELFPQYGRIIENFIKLSTLYNAKC